ncbi:MAG: hypothetical protein FWF34_00555 [Alphaproteobacteria bacterium]|nr:hypothetical protein [Alphaproteobacteria bacterium]MCL2889738.1 hypothetical protein [Alphaproteobacteria bacterium]
MKKLSILVSVLAVTAVLGGCSSSNEPKTGEFVQTHQRDNITEVSARIVQVRGEQTTRLGEVRFRERESGLQMLADLNNLRANTEYRFVVYNLVDCTVPGAVKKDEKCPDNKKTAAKKDCEKERSDIRLPAFHADANGRANISFLANGVTAAELNNTKIGLTRGGVKVGHGMLTERNWLGL